MEIVTLPVQHGRAISGVRWPYPELEYEWFEYHDKGATEPWVAQAVCSLVMATGAKTVLETGGYVGLTSAWITWTLEKMSGDVSAPSPSKFIVAELDEERGKIIQARLESFPHPNTEVCVAFTDALQTIHSVPGQYLDVAFVDDDHQKHHVEQEIVNLWPKMKPGGLMLFHDVASDGVCQLGPLIRKYGGVALDFPRLGPDGGLGIIPIPK